MLDLTDQLLAGVVGGMRLAGEHQLHRPVAREQQPLEPVGLRQQQGGALVGGEAAREPDGEGAGIEHRLRPLDVARAEAARHQLVPQPRADERHQRLAALLARAPQLVVVRLGEPRPALGVGLVPVGEHVLREEVGHPRRHPGAGVHAVGDRGDRDLVGGHIRPEVAEHLAADLAVQLGHRVGASGQAQAHHRHVEALVGLVAGAVTELHQLVER